MGIFRTAIEVAPLANPERKQSIAGVMVDTGSEYSWVPGDILRAVGITPQRVERFETADGRVLEREIGFGMLYASGRAAPSIFVFAGDGDMTLLGAFGLEGLNFRVDLVRRQLVPAGPVPAAAA